MAPATRRNPSNPPDENQNNNTPPNPARVDIDDGEEQNMLDEDEEEVAAPTAANMAILLAAHHESQRRINALEQARRANPVSTHEYPRDPKTPDPPPFHGKAIDFRNFIASVALKFTLCPNTYVTDEHKVLYVISLLRDNAMTWARDIPINERHPLRHDYAAFHAELSNLYEDRNLKASCEDKLSVLSQTKSAADYAVEFQTLIAPLDVNDNGQRLLFYQGLKPNVKDAISTVGRKETLKLLVDQAISIDQREFQRSKERKLEDRISTAPTGLKRTAPSSTNNSSQQPRGPLTPAEKKRREDNALCRYCASPDHNVLLCPNKPNSTPHASASTITIVSENAYSQVPEART
jgi:hypothetical protein